MSFCATASSSCSSKLCCWFIATLVLRLDFCSNSRGARPRAVLVVEQLGIDGREAQLRRRAWPAEQVALHEVDACRAQHIVLVLGLDAFRRGRSEEHTSE